jgi:hypothetical protein
VWVSGQNVRKMVEVRLEVMVVCNCKARGATRRKTKKAEDVVGSSRLA